MSRQDIEEYFGEMVIAGAIGQVSSAAAEADAFVTYSRLMLNGPILGGAAIRPFVRGMGSASYVSGSPRSCLV